MLDSGTMELSTDVPVQNLTCSSKKTFKKKINSVESDRATEAGMAFEERSSSLFEVKIIVLIHKRLFNSRLLYN